MYEYYTFPGSGEVLVQIFNSVAMICGGNDFVGLMQVAALLGFLVCLVVAVYKLDIKDSFVYLFVVSGIWLVMMVPKVTVNIVETSGHNMSAVAYKVDNVPFGLAVTGNIISKFGTWMTKEAEKVNSLPNDLQYSETGVLFGNRLLRQLHGTNLTNQILQDDWTRFMDQCSFYDMNFYHKYSLNDLLDSNDILATLGNTNQSLYTTVTELTTKESEAMTCKNAYLRLYTATNSNIINSVVPENAQRALVMLGWTQDNVGSGYASIYTSMGDSTLQYMFKNASADSLDSIRQAAMINMVKNAEIRNASAMNNQQRLSVALATAQAERQWIMSQQTGGAQASGFLPVMRATLEGIIIGLFPFVMFIALLGGIAAFKTIMFYVMTLFWLQLWAPLASIMNLVLSSRSQGNIYSSIFEQGNVTLRNSYSVLQAAVEGEAMAGYAYWLIPMLSFSIVYGGRGLGNAMIGLVGSGQNVGNAAGAETAKGNVNMGNISYNNTSANKSSADVIYTDPGMVRTNNATGSYSWNSGQEGSLRASATRNDLPVSSQATIKTSDAYSQKAAQSIQAAQSQEAMASAATTMGNAYTMAYASSVGTNTSAGRELGSRLSADEKRSIQEVAKASQNLNEKWGVKHDSMASSALSLGLNLSKAKKGGGGGSGDTTANKEETRGAVAQFLESQRQKIGVAGSIGAKGEARNSDIMSRDVMTQVEALQQKGVEFNDSMAKSISESSSFREDAQSGNSLAQNAQASYSAAQSATLSARQSYTEAQSYEQQAQKASESNATITMDTSHATAQQYLGSGGHLGEMYQQPGAHTEAIQVSGQSAIAGKRSLEQATAGSDYNPSHQLQSSDKPVNQVDQTHQANVSQLNKGSSAAFNKIEQAARADGIDSSQIKTDIGTQKSGLEGGLSDRGQAFNQNYQGATESIGKDNENLKGSYSDALEATSPTQRLNSAQYRPHAKSEGNNGTANDMVKDIGSEVVNRTQVQMPGSGTTQEGFTEKQQQIQQENTEYSKPSAMLDGILGGSSSAGSGSVTIQGFKPPKPNKTEDDNSPKS